MPLNFSPNGPSSSAATVNQSFDITNLTLACSVSGNALTVAVKTSAGTDPTGSDIVYASFRNATLATGTYSRASITSALSLTVSSGSTLGMANSISTYLWVYLINNAGTLELAISQRLFDECLLVSTTAEGGAGAADSNRVMYSTTARSNVPFRLIGRLNTSQTTAGTWTSVPTEISVGDFGNLSKSYKEIFYTTATTPSGILNNSYNTVTFNNKSVDTVNSYSAGVFTAVAGGIYTYNAVIEASGTFSANQYLGLATYVNDIDILMYGFDTAGSNSQTNLVARISNVIRMSSGDSFRICSISNGGGLSYSTNLTSANISLSWIGF